MCLSATMERIDGREVILKKFCPIVDEITLDEALKNNWVSKFNTYLVLVEPDDKDEYDEIKDSAVKNYVTRIFRGTNPSKDYRDNSGRALHFGKDGSYARGLREALKIMQNNNWTINTLHKKYAVVRSSLRSRGKRFKGILKNGLKGLLQN